MSVETPRFNELKRTHDKVVRECGRQTGLKARRRFMQIRKELRPVIEITELNMGMGMWSISTKPVVTRESDGSEGSADGDAIVRWVEGVLGECRTTSWDIPSVTRRHRRLLIEMVRLLNWVLDEPEVPCISYLPSSSIL